MAHDHHDDDSTRVIKPQRLCSPEQRQCVHDGDFHDLKKKVTALEEKQAMGAVDFAKLDMRMEHLTSTVMEALEQLKSQKINWVHKGIEAFIFWIIPIAGASWILSLAKTIQESQK